MPTMTATTDDKKYAEMPWQTLRDPEIPWEDRIYALSLTTGRIVALDEKWLPDPENPGKMKRVEDTLDNNSKYPTMTFGEAKALAITSEEQSEALSMVFARLYGRERLTVVQLGKLAHIPKFYAKPAARMAKIEKARRQDQEDEMLSAAGIQIPSFAKPDVKAKS